VPELKYAVCSGPVISEYDGEKHVVPCSELVHLYGVSPSECIMIPWDGPERDHLLRRAKNLGLTFLRSRDDGNYVLPEEGE